LSSIATGGDAVSSSLSTYWPFSANARSIAVAALLTLGWAAQSAAGTLSIEYEISGGTVITPPGGTINGGMYTVEFDASGSFTIVPGPAILKSFRFSGSDTYLTYGDTISTNFNVQLNGELAGNGTLAGGFSNAAPAVFSGPAGLHCSGGTCAVAGFVQSVTKFYTLLVSAPQAGIAINPAGASISGTYQLVGLTSGAASMSFIGQEVSRTFVPEPDRDWLALAALVSIAGLRTMFRGAPAAQRR
jgi:hypothetical protein